MSDGVVAFQLNDGDQVFIETTGGPSGGATRGLEPTEIVQRVSATFEEVVAKMRAPVNALIKTFEQAASGVDEVELKLRARLPCRRGRHHHEGGRRDEHRGVDPLEARRGPDEAAAAIGSRRLSSASPVAYCSPLLAGG